MIGGVILAAWTLPVLLSATSTAAAAPPDQELAVDLSKHEVSVAVNYAGADLVLFGATEGIGDVVVEVRGPLRAEVVRQKERVAGIWLDRNEMVFERVPAFYAIASSGPLDGILPLPEQVREHIGPENQWLVPPSGVSAKDVAIFRAALMRNKQRERLFPVEPTEVRFLGNRLFRTDIHFPANASVGPYQVKVLLVKNGKIVSSAQTPLILSRVGFEARVFELAHAQSLAYGILAIAIAIMAGWLASVFFRGKA
jgi:uncharacterized protein (TIGR02186 family)